MYHHRHRGDFAQPGIRGVDALLDRLTGLADLPALQFHRMGLHDHDHSHGDEPADEDDILAAFRRRAEALHEKVVHEHGVFVVEFLGATGSGKTRIVERLIERAPDDERIGVIVGDVAGDDDASRFRALGVEVVNVNTGKECHLDPGLVENAIEEFDLDALDTLYIENVGNMVCPADFPLGAQARVLVVSTTEGDDVVRKHPLLFQACDATVINKVDIADAVDADVATMREDVKRVNARMPVFETSARDNVGLDDLVALLEDARDHGHAHEGHDHVHAHDGGHDHEHVHSHDHDDEAVHSHDHEHVHAHDHEHTHVDEDGEEYVHSHDHEHVHSHDHDHRHDDAHGHSHEADHAHEHIHDHEHEHEDDPEHEGDAPVHDHAHDDEDAREHDEA